MSDEDPLAEAIRNEDRIVEAIRNEDRIVEAIRNEDEIGFATVEFEADGLATSGGEIVGHATTGKFGNTDTDAVVVWVTDDGTPGGSITRQVMLPIRRVTAISHEWGHMPREDWEDRQ